MKRKQVYLLLAECEGYTYDKDYSEVAGRPIYQKLDKGAILTAPDYLVSIDALIPIWTRYQALPEFEVRLRGPNDTLIYSCRMSFPHTETWFVGPFESIQEAAARATAIAVQEYQKYLKELSKHYEGPGL